jgi:uncharacterized protein (DUF3084 family)
MTLEDKFKKQLGDLAFTMTVLQHQLEESELEKNKIREELDKLKEDKNVRNTKSKES